jgi:hypothetical protein
MAVTPHDAPGTTVVFSGSTYTVTNVSISYSDVSGQTDRIDISHLGQTTGETMLTQARPLKGSATGETGKEVSFDYIGTTQLAGGTSGSFVVGTYITGATATVVSSSVTLAMNDVIRGSATVRVTA